MYWIALQPKREAPGASAADALVDPLTALAWWTLQFTPMVARVDDTLVLEISGSERLFGGRKALVERIYTQNKPVALVDHARGATSLIAMGRLWSGAVRSPPDDLPLTALAAARPHVPTLTRLGCRTWGALRALPRGGLVRRFGADLVAALDRAYAQAPEVYPWLALPEVLDAPLELPASVETAPAPMFGARRLLAQLLVWLQLRQRGVLALELLWQLDARRSNALHLDAHHAGTGLGRLELRTAQPTQDTAHLQRILAEQLARVTLPAPVQHLRLRTLQTQPLAGDSLSLLPDDVRPGDSLHHLLERLSARLGPQQVQSVSACADHRPERMQRWAPVASHQFLPNATKVIAGSASTIWPAGQNASKNQDALLPTWLLVQPQRLGVQRGQPVYHGALDLLAGPHRIEAGWLDGPAHCALRDYFVARSPQAGLVWVYRERLAAPPPASGVAQWFLHGVFA